MSAVIAIHGLRYEPIQKRAVSTRLRILRAAKEAIEEKGRDRFTTADVVDRAGLSIGTVYRYFEDRVAIIKVLYPDAVEGLGDAIDLEPAVQS